MYYSHFHMYMVYIFAASVNGVQSLLSLPPWRPRYASRCVENVSHPNPLPVPCQLLPERLAVWNKHKLLRDENTQVTGQLAFRPERGCRIPQRKGEAGIETDRFIRKHMGHVTSRGSYHRLLLFGSSDEWQMWLSHERKDYPPFRRENKFPLC